MCVYVTYTAKKGPISSDYSEKVDKGVKAFKSKKDIYAPISDKESRNNGCHVESSYLCHGIWEKIMKNKKPLSTDNKIRWSSNETDELVFHFDIMNNPSMSNNVYSCGLFKACNQKLREDALNIYHSIGNMAPIPWFKLAGTSYIDGQSLHKSLDERWDLFLQVLKDNWNKWNNECVNLTFENYMIMTCQQVYYEEIYIKALKTGVENITLEHITDWNEHISQDSVIISLSPKESENTDDIINKILQIIKMRCKIIHIMLEKEEP